MSAAQTERLCEKYICLEFAMIECAGEDSDNDDMPELEEVADDDCCCDCHDSSDILRHDCTPAAIDASAAVLPLCPSSARRTEITGQVFSSRHELWKPQGMKPLPKGERYSVSDIRGTPPEQCAVGCPACPRDEVNIPDDWSEDRLPWSYRVQLSADSKFRMSNRLTRSIDSTSPGKTVTHKAPLTDGEQAERFWANTTVAGSYDVACLIRTGLSPCAHERTKAKL